MNINCNIIIKNKDTLIYVKKFNTIFLVVYL